MKLTSTKYKTGFSTASLLRKEAVPAIANLKSYVNFLAGEEEIDENSLPVNSESSKKRWALELTNRLRSLPNPEFLEYIASGNPLDQNTVLFYATCKYYQLLKEYMLQNVVAKWKDMDVKMDPEDFERFFHQKTRFNPELLNLTDSTRKMLGTRTSKMLKELGIVQNGCLVKQEYNPSLLNLIAKAGDVWFLHVLLLNESEAKAIINL